jgi:hypothetical protein
MRFDRITVNSQRMNGQPCEAGLDTIHVGEIGFSTAADTGYWFPLVLTTK